MSVVRRPAVAGRFYPADAAELRRDVERYLAAAAPLHAEGAPPKAIVVPHAGYRYSGVVAASAYALVRGEVERVVLLGPAHRRAFRGLAAHGADAFATPLGLVPVERTFLRALDAAHDGEHCLEVQLPFLQVRCGRFRLVPALVGDVSGEEMADVLGRLWGGPETLVVVSSDLSHFHDHETARRIDRSTAEAITSLQPERLDGDRACGWRPLAGLLTVAKRKGLGVRAVDLRSSGDTTGPLDRVVGYGAFVVEEADGGVFPPV